VDELIRVDEELDDPLFDALEADLERSDRILDELRFDSRRPGGSLRHRLHQPCLRRERGRPRDLR
jgi:hypothetical protein